VPNSANENIRIKYGKRLRLGIALILGAILTGILGYMFLENYTFSEAFYMTIITISTVGYGEVKPLDNTGRIFTSLLIICNLGIFAYAVSIVTNFVAEGNLKIYFRYRSMQKQIEKLSGHIVVCGYGRNGRQVCDMIEVSKQPYVVIESNHENIELLHNKPNVLFIEGDATDDSVLMDAGITAAKALITTLPKDPDNVYVVLTAKEKNPSIHIVSRASDE
jgi:voltage-gated potassium channel